MMTFGIEIPYGRIVEWIDVYISNVYRPSAILYWIAHVGELQIGLCANFTARAYVNRHLWTWHKLMYNNV